MGKISKTLALFLLLIIALPCLTLLTVNTANAQTKQAPSAPEFTVTLTNPNTNNRHDIIIKIKNQPLDSICYIVETKEHLQKNWSLVHYWNKAPKYDHGDPYQKQNSTSEYTILEYTSLEGQYFPSNGLLDIRVQALIGEPYLVTPTTRFYYIDAHWRLSNAGPVSEWSEIQTLSIPDGNVTPTKNPTPTPTPTSSPTPTPPTLSPTSSMPTINTGPHMPEPFPTSLLVAALVIIAVVIASVLLFRKYRKTVNLKQ